MRLRLRGVSVARPGPQSCRPAGEEGPQAPGRSNKRRYAERDPAAGQRLLDFRHVVADPGGRAYANGCADIARLRKGKAMRQVHSSAAFTLAIILLGVPARPQSVPSRQASANDLARRVITNELEFQDDHQLDVPTRKRTVWEETGRGNH